jgi:putative addiction module component (TIGR02574 family)
MLTKEIKTLSKPEKILLVEELWNNIADKKIAVSQDEREYIKGRLDTIKSGKNKIRKWSEIKNDLLTG